jgi:hypothetical protein
MTTVAMQLPVSIGIKHDQQQNWIQIYINIYMRSETFRTYTAIAYIDCLYLFHYKYDDDDDDEEDDCTE